MANIKSAKKDIRKTARRTMRNTKMYVVLDKALKAVKTKQKGAIESLYSVLDKMVSQKIMKKNAAARKKSRVMHQMKHV